VKTPRHDLAGMSMLDLFRTEAETQASILTNGLLELERGTPSSQSFEMLMRAAHSLKGAARIVNLQAGVHLAHALEDCFVSAQQGKLAPKQPQIDLLLRASDVLAQLAKNADADFSAWENAHAAEIKQLLSALRDVSSPQPGPGTHDALEKRPRARLPASSPGTRLPEKTGPRHHDLQKVSPDQPPQAQGGDRVLRLNAENLNRLLGLAGESLVESRWLRPFSDSLQQLKRHHMDLSQQVEHLRLALQEDQPWHVADKHAGELLQRLADCQKFLGEKMQDLDIFDRRSAHLSQRLYLEVLRTRMRPFSDGVRRFPRMVRDLSRTLEKQVNLEVQGENTPVDRDILEQLETPLAHLLRNAVDHGCERPEDRVRAGKPAECCLRLEARHSAGALLISVSDDGAGVDLDQLRATIIRKGLATPVMVEKFSEPELLEFLLLPGFTLKDIVTEISGRGFGLDIVQNMVKSVRGGIRISNQAGRGLRVQLQLPLTLSVVRALLVEIAGEPYAIPLGQIGRTLKLSRAAIHTLEGRHYFNFAGQQIGLITARELLSSPDIKAPGEDLPVIVLGERSTRFGVVVDRFLGERELVVQPIDPRLGKIKNISSAALMEDGCPVLIIDVEDTIRSIEKLIADGTFASMRRDPLSLTTGRPKRILAVDDSLTVREMERKLLSKCGYVADVAIDGVEAWSAVRSGLYDLVITDMDMPRMDGIELADRIKRDPQLRSVPVLVVSYKDRQEDRMRALEAGADFYLAKGGLQSEEILLQTIIDLIGAPGA
jgi:two-component system, chemotaxis family, sensor histidine kinase and response regulator WspE